MDRNLHPSNVPFCPTRIAPVDQYMWPELDQTERVCENGITHPIYNCAGDISFTLPLNEYPKECEVHPQIRYSRFPHFGHRDPQTKAYVDAMVHDWQTRRLEGLYM